MIPTSLSLAMYLSLPFVRLEDQIAVHDHPRWKPWPDRQRRLNIEILLNDLLAGLVEAIASPLPGQATDRVVSSVLLSSPLQARVEPRAQIADRARA